MFHSKALIAAPVSLLLMAGSSHAALTAGQVWKSWQDAGAGFGFDLDAATQLADGGTLRLNGVTLRLAGDAAGPGLMMADIVMTEAADGSVAIALASEAQADLGSDVSEGAVIVTHDGLTITVRDEAGTLQYDYAAKQLKANFAFSVGSDIPEVQEELLETSFGGDITIAGLAGQFTDAPGALRSIAAVVRADQFAYDFQSTDEYLGMETAQTAQSSDVEMVLDARLPETLVWVGIDTPEWLASALKDGLFAQLKVRQGITTQTDRNTSEFMPYDMQMTSLPGTGDFTLDQNGFVMNAEGAGGDLTFKMPDIPVDAIKVGFGPLVMNMAMPLIGQDGPSDFGLTLKLADVVLNEEVWAMFDPTVMFKRDPASLVLDVVGTARFDLLGLIAADEAGITDYIQPTPETLEIREFSLNAGGADVSGSGAFTFDNAAVQGGGMPVPIGKASFVVNGANAIIDGMVAAGMMTAEEANYGRLGMGMVLTPGDGPDQMTSDIDARADGSIYVNGERLK